MIDQNSLERIEDKMARGHLTAAQANIEMVLCARFRLVTSRMPKDVRLALNGAVKDGVLERITREGVKPEVYFHPTFDHLARDARNKHGSNVLKALAETLA